MLDVGSCAGLGADGYRRAGWLVTCLDRDRAALRHAAAAGHETVQDDMPGVVQCCASSFGLKAQRHRLFAPGGGVELVGTTCDHGIFDRDPITNKPRPWGVYYAKGDNIPKGGRTVATLEHGHEVMGVTDRTVPWKYLCEGLPPAMTEHIGRQLLEHVVSAVAA